MTTTTLLTFLKSDNLFLLDIFSYVLFLKRVVIYLKRFLFPVKSKRLNLGGSRWGRVGEGVDDKMWG